jgi:hypothetical protein
VFAFQLGRESPATEAAVQKLVAATASAGSGTAVAATTTTGVATGVATATAKAAAAERYQTTNAAEQVANPATEEATTTTAVIATATAVAAATAVATAVTTVVATATGRCAADRYGDLLANNAGNANRYGVRNLLANATADVDATGFANLTADAVRNLAGPGLALPAGRAARNLLAAGFAFPTGLANLAGPGLAFPTGNAAVDGPGARLANGPANSHGALFANRFAAVLGHANFAGFAGRNPALAADGPVRRAASDAAPAARAEPAATGARVKAERAAVANALRVRPARNDFLAGFPMATANCNRPVFGVGNTNRAGNVPHLGFLNTTANHRGDFAGLHFANRDADGVFNRLHLANRAANGVVHGPVGRLTNRATNGVFHRAVRRFADRPGHRHLFLLGDCPVYVPHPGYFLTVINRPADRPHRGVAAAAGVTGDGGSRGSYGVIAGSATTLGEAGAGRHRSQDGCRGQQSSNQSHVDSPKKLTLKHP